MADGEQRGNGAGAGKDTFHTGYLVHEVSRLRRHWYDRQSRHLGITSSQRWLLFTLSCHDGPPPNQNELAQMIDLGSAAVGELILRLERAGFVRRVCDPLDRRVRRVEIAERGTEVLERLRQIAYVNNARVMAGFSAEEHALLDSLLSRMKANLTALHEDARAAATDDDEPTERRGAPAAPLEA